MTYAYSAIRRHLRLSSDAGGAGGGGGQGDPPAGGKQDDGDGEDDGDGDGSGGGDEDDDLSEADLAKLKSTIKKERQQRRDAAKQARELATWKQEREKKDQEAADEEAKKKGEWETVATNASTRADTAEAALKQERILSAVHLAAVAANFHDPEDVHKFIDLGKVELGDDGRPKRTVVKNLVEDLAKAKPHLVKSERGPGLPEPGQGNRGGGQANAAQSYIAARYTPRAKG
jgi:hypothetical protein